MHDQLHAKARRNGQGYSTSLIRGAYSINGEVQKTYCVYYGDYWFFDVNGHLPSACIWLVPGSIDM